MLIIYVRVVYFESIIAMFFQRGKQEGPQNKLN